MMLIEDLLKKIIAMFFLMCAVSASANFDECILDTMPGAQSERAAVLIEKSCREIFPKPDIRKLSTKLSDDQKQNITGRGGIDDITNVFSGTLLNQNERVRITGILIGLYTGDFDVANAEKYFDEVSVPPFTKGSFNFPVFSNFADADLNWTILEVWGTTSQ